jgi:hypothetical protein
MYSLRRVGDGVGCVGRHSNAVKINQPESPNKIMSIGPTVGCSMIVRQDFATWWQTTEITEILEDRPTFVRFKTLNSEYEWEIIE